MSKVWKLKFGKNDKTTHNIKMGLIQNFIFNSKLKMKLLKLSCFRFRKNDFNP